MRCIQWQWPLLQFTRDCGADGKAFTSFLTYHPVRRINIDTRSDPLHDAHNDVKTNESDCGKKSIRLLSVLAEGVLVGPFNGGARHAQVREAVGEAFRIIDPESDAAWLEALP